VTRAKTAFAALQAANPVPVERNGGRRSVSAIRVALALVALAICFLVVAPAVGIRVPALDFWTADKAPPKIVEDFASLSEGAPPGMDPGAISGQARKVTLPGGHILWVAPTRHGGFCTQGIVGGGCDKLGTVPLGVSWGASRVSLEEMKRTPVPTGIFDRVDGFVNAEYADWVEVRFADGETYRPKLTWVSEPIGAGFFFYEVPADRRRPGHEIEAIVALNGDGDVVFEDSHAARTSLAGVRMDDRDEKVRLATRSGEAVIWEAPTRYEGRCAWLEYHDRTLLFVPCLPKGYPFPPFALRFVPLRSEVLLIGAVDRKYASVEIRFADDEKIVARPRDGFLLTEIPVEHLVRGREAALILGRDSDGNELAPRLPVSAFGGRHYRCLAPLPVDEDVREPFCL
jgi:hypothetical protein